MSKHLGWVAGLMVVVGAAQAAVASEPAEPPRVYGPRDKLVRGLGNFFTGFIEIPRNMYNVTRDQNLLSRWTVGLGEGLGYTALRMVTGVYEVVTFPFSIPENYEPVVKPEFVWEAPGPRYK